MTSANVAAPASRITIPTLVPNPELGVSALQDPFIEVKAKCSRIMSYAQTWEKAITSTDSVSADDEDFKEYLTNTNSLLGNFIKEIDGAYDVEGKRWQRKEGLTR